MVWVGRWCEKLFKNRIVEMFEIKNLGGEVLCSGETTRAAVEEAVANRISLAEADLVGADLTGADLTGADLTGADVRGALMQGVNLKWANIHDLRYNPGDIYWSSFIGGGYSNSARFY